MAIDTLLPDEVGEKRRAARREYQRQWQRENADKVRDRKRLYYEGNREAILASRRQQRTKDPERFRGYTRRYQNANREKYRAIVRESMRRYRANESNYEKSLAEYRRRYAENTEKYRAYVDAWQQANPGRRRAHSARRMSRMERRTPDWVGYEELIEVYQKCPKGMHVDHIVPVVGKTIEGYKVSGLHVPWNLQYLTPEENMKKHNRMRPEDHALAGAPVFAVGRQLSFFDD
jgi:hypothetical protein